ncbi:MAG: hypothetical protein BYD32DRAFT_452972 [Podila humilis]|nr:MAG: hypothetical protein BYD32DRAFT_452972 [Podila humilis]
MLYRRWGGCDGGSLVLVSPISGTPDIAGWSGPSLICSSENDTWRWGSGTSLVPLVGPAARSRSSVHRSGAGSAGRCPVADGPKGRGVVGGLIVALRVACTEFAQGLCPNTDTVDTALVLAGTVAVALEDRG